MINPSMLKQIKEMQQEIKRVQAEINASTFYGQAGGSVVKVAAKGTKKIESIEIKKDEIDMNDVEMLQDLIVVALNDVFYKIDKELEETLGVLTKGMNIPGMF